MITLTSITDPHSKIIALQGFAQELKSRPDCKTAYRLAMKRIRVAELRLEKAKNND